MAKSINTKYTTFALCDKNNKARFSMYLPMQYSLADILYIISEYTGYKNNREWNIYNPYKKELAIKNATARDDLDSISFSHFRGITPVIAITYGSSCIAIGSRNFRKSSKVYPFEIIGVEYFPAEDEVSKKELPEKTLYDFNKLYLLYLDMRSQVHYRDDDAFLDFQSAITAHFKQKYRISDEMTAGFYGDENLLVRR